MPVMVMILWMLEIIIFSYMAGLGIILYLIMDKIPLLMGSEIRIMQKP